MMLWATVVAAIMVASSSSRFFFASGFDSLAVLPSATADGLGALYLKRPRSTTETLSVAVVER